MTTIDGGDKAFLLLAAIAAICFCTCIGWCAARDWQAKNLQMTCVQKTGNPECEKPKTNGSSAK